MTEEFDVTTADMLEIIAGGGNGIEYVDIVSLIEKAAKELREQAYEIERLREALQAIYKHQKRMPNIDATIWELTRAALGEKK